MANKNIFFIFFLLSLLCYGIVLNGPFLFDDRHLIQQNISVQSLQYIPEIYSGTILKDAGIEGDFYRPNRQLLFALTYTLSGGQSTILFHLVSILLHALNACLLFLILLKLRQNRHVSFVTSLLFLIHPLQTEAVAYISGLGDPLGFFFLLLALQQYLNLISNKGSTHRPKQLLLSVLYFALALFSKENMVVFLPLVLLLTIYLLYEDQLPIWPLKLNMAPQWVSKNRVKVQSLKSFLLPFALYSLLTFGFIFFRFFLFETRESFRYVPAAAPYTENLWIRIWSFIHILWEYFSLLFYPRDLFFEKPFLITPWNITLEGVFGLLLILCFVFSVVFYRNFRPLFFGLGWFFVTMIPFMGIIPINAVFLEHWLYIPSIGIFFLIALLFDKIRTTKLKSFSYLLIVIISFLLIARTIDRNRDWADEERFYKNELKFAPNSQRFLNNLGGYYARNQKYEKAIPYFQKAKINGNAADPYYNLSVLYIELIQVKKVEEQQLVNRALHELYLGLQIDPNHFYSLNFTQKIYQSYGQNDRANKVSLLLQNIKKGIKNQKIDIQKAMRNRNDGY